MKMNNQASKSQRMKNDFYIIDDLLLQILFRLPCSESVIKCKCVRKQWCKVISEPGFDAKFIAHKINNSHLSTSKNEEQLPSIFGLRRYDKNPLIYPTHPTFTNIDFSLSFIPTHEQGPRYRIVVKAQCSDLVVCISPSPKDLDLYVCNPRTKQYFQLPPPSQNKHPALIGFTCDPFYVFDKESGQVTSCRFSVCYACVAGPVTDKSEIEIFSSENRVWRKAILLTPQYFDYNYATLKNCFTYKEVLHFYSEYAIIGFDPYKINEDGEIHTHFIQMPPFDATANHIRSVCIGVFGGKILVAEFCARYVHPRELINTAQVSNISIIEPPSSAYCIKVWELNNYSTGEWSMKHMIYFHELVSPDSLLTLYTMRGCPNSEVLFFHPNDADTVLLMLPKLVDECNLKDKTLKRVCNFSKQLQKVYGVAFPWWPSPLPSIV